MHYRSKYIVTRGLNGIEQPFVFSELASHAEVADALGGPVWVTGAGFCYINETGKYKCYGESVSLKVKSREQVDADLINRLFGIDEF